MVQAIEAWCESFLRDDDSVPNGDDHHYQSGAHVKPPQGKNKTLVHEVRIRNQVIYLDPPMELARQEWILQFQDVLSKSISMTDWFLTIGTVCDLPRIRSSRYEITLQVDQEDASDSTFLRLVSDSLSTEGTTAERLAHVVRGQPS